MNADAPGKLLRALGAHGWTVGTAESLTAGLLVATLVRVPGASTVVRGGIAAYATDLKRTVLGVDPDLLAARGAVDAEVARQMASGAVRVLGADVGIATTGVAGPDPQDGQPVGRVHIAVVTPRGTGARTLDLSGDREAIRAATVEHAIALCAAQL